MRLTREQAAIIGAYTGVLCGPFNDLHKYAEEKLGRPVFTHEFANKEVADEMAKACKEDFIAICAEEK